MAASQGSRVSSSVARDLRPMRGSRYGFGVGFGGWLKWRGGYCCCW